MTRILWGAAVATLITLSGCGAVETGAALTPSPLAAEAMPQAVAKATYGLLLASTAMVPEVCASSTRAYFPLCQVNDGKPTTAWTAEKTDCHPSLTYSWCEPVDVKKLNIKLSPAGTKVEMEAYDGNCWQPVGCYTPTAGTNWCKTIPGCTRAEKVRLTFKNCKTDQLRVCEANVGVRASKDRPS